MLGDKTSAADVADVALMLMLLLSLVLQLHFLVLGGTNHAVHETIEGAALAYVLIVGVYHLFTHHKTHH